MTKLSCNYQPFEILIERPSKLLARAQNLLLIQTIISSEKWCTHIRVKPHYSKRERDRERVTERGRESEGERGHTILPEMYK